MTKRKRNNAFVKKPIVNCKWKQEHHQLVGIAPYQGWTLCKVPKYRGRPNTINNSRAKAKKLGDACRSRLLDKKYKVCFHLSG
jgi:hypothetical protein